MGARGGLRLGLGLFVTAGFVWLIARQLRGDELLAALRGVDPAWLGLGLACFCLGFACRIRRWQLMLRAARPAVRWRACAGPFVASFALNNVLPLRAGDVLRAVGFNRQLGVGAGSVTATLFVERLLDMLMLLCALGLVLVLFDLRLQQVARIGGTALLALAACVALLLLVPRISSAAVGLGQRLLARLAPALAARLAPEIARGLASLQALASGAWMGRLLLWSAASWCLEGAMFWCVAQAVPALTAPHGAWLAFPVATLSTLVPSSPGYVGTFDYFASLAMRLLGNPDAAAAAYAIVVHLLLWLPPTLLGLAYLLMAPPDRLLPKERTV
ncbi:lysylphosphatidylglycerol synthase transmembrane domain-containing protein [Pseudorhodoferax sp. Leaf267]|uniref:lysylphosphatidylglycerol synthase transmembrane domain-containing protein n=1 Tax=Pseudorhodoferax sp. Leaf267 TaxID=1736316 RepID=UPI0006F89766|nr:lysylphosphatidylglycerol synthase transmembrane domain-containing protein [Pseudorhodoferax sp. Leaf267]KQP11884.1 lysylphosphatidylglycerol synthetase [Pseudorhodoferax sp. Leaf267]